MRLIDKISSETLKKLYWHDKLSSVEIAKIYHCDPKYVRQLLKKYGIRIRAKSEAKKILIGIEISKEELKRLYLEQKLSSTEIAEKLKCSPSLIVKRLKAYKIPSRSCQEAHLLCNKPRYKRYNFSGDLEEKTYLIGFRSGDFHVHPTSSRSITVSMNSSKLAQIKLFGKLFSNYGHVWKGDPDKTGAIQMHTYLNRETFKFLINKRDSVDPWILKNTKYFAAFLAGYTDAEGSFCLCRGDGVFNIRSQDKNILHQIRAKLIGLGILLRPPQIARQKGTRDKRGTVSNEDIWGVWIHRKNALLKLIDLLSPYLKHVGKRKGMKVVKENVLWRNRKYKRHQRSKWGELPSVKTNGFLLQRQPVVSPQA